MITMIEEIRTLFMCLFPIYVVLSLVRIVRWGHIHDLDLRGRLGVVGLTSGIASYILYAIFYGYLWYFHKLIAHGSHLWIYYYVGGCAAALGFLGALGKVSNISSLTISLVMIFQWWREMVPSVSAGAALTILMFISLSIITLIFWGMRLLARKKSSS